MVAGASLGLAPLLVGAASAGTPPPTRHFARAAAPSPLPGLGRVEAIASAFGSIAVESPLPLQMSGCSGVSLAAASI
eukprot:2359031-Alexandrium_andersonii.AAC.1